MASKATIFSNIDVFQDDLTQQDFTIEGNQASFEGISVKTNRDSILADPGDDDIQKKIFKFDIGSLSEGDGSLGSITVIVLPVAGDSFLLNGLTYTAVAASPGEGEFLIGGSLAATATNIETSINADTRTGTLGTLIADVDTGVDTRVNITSSILGQGGQAVTFSTTDTDKFTIVAFAGGDALTTNFQLNARVLKIDGTIQATEVPAFFDNTTNTETASQLIPIRVSDINGTITYNIFWPTAASGGQMLDLWYGTIQTPGDIVTTDFIDTGATANPALSYTLVERGRSGIIRSYDYFFVTAN